MTRSSLPPLPASGGDAPAAPDLPAPRSHEEWLLDESLAETFPASDPIAPALPKEHGHR
ncbi:MAG TPA: hypothetical protein VLU41_06435 [Ideonella sp.]|nr:hypothetical protein [Ideonella sp.]